LEKLTRGLSRPDNLISINGQRNGNTGLASGVTTLSQVTNGVGTVSQGLTTLGTFTEPLQEQNNWQVYTWVPLRDSGGNLVKFTGGSVKTLRAAITAANQNAHFYALFAGKH